MADNDVIQDANPQDLPGPAEALRTFPIFPAQRRVPGRVLCGVQDYAEKSPARPISSGDEQCRSPHNYRLSRKASTLSLALKRPDLTEGSLVFSRACCFICKSASMYMWVVAVDS